MNEWINSGSMKLEFYGKEIQIADAFTKVLGKHLFTKFRSMIGLSEDIPERSIMEGVCGRTGRKDIVVGRSVSTGSGRDIDDEAGDVKVVALKKKITNHKTGVLIFS
jgi:hypothetical protein